MAGAAQARIAADVGGTFTDVAVFDERHRRLALGKTPVHAPSHGRRDGRRASPRPARASARGGAVPARHHRRDQRDARAQGRAHRARHHTRGFRDVYEIGRINRPEAYNLFFRKHRPLVERALRYRGERAVTAAGDGPARRSTRPSLSRSRSASRRSSVQAIAILFLHSYRNPDHEIARQAILPRRLPGVFVIASHELSQEYREFERTSTVVANAFVGPRVDRYLTEMASASSAKGFPGTVPDRAVDRRAVRRRRRPAANASGCSNPARPPA